MSLARGKRFVANLGSVTDASEGPLQRARAAGGNEMAEFDVVIRGGMVIDGTRMPRYRADVGIKDGKVAKIGNLKAHQAKKVVDAGGLPIMMRSCSGTRIARFRAGMASPRS